jgi:hypothetical protein
MTEQKGGSVGKLVKRLQGIAQISLAVHIGPTCFAMDAGKSMNMPVTLTDLKVN